MTSLGAFVFFVAAAATCGSAFYLPGVAPKEYVQGEKVSIKVNSLTSTKTQIPFEYYKLPFCKPEAGIVNAAENLGEVLTANMIENTGFEIEMGVKKVCKVLCRKQFNAKMVNKFVRRIENEYVVNLLVDNLPAATEVQIQDGGGILPVYEHGYPIGGAIISPGKKKNTHFLNNHLRMTIKWHQPEGMGKEGHRIVGFLVEPFSVKHTYKGKWSDKTTDLTSCSQLSDVKHVYDQGYPQRIDQAGEVIFTYDVLWEQSDVRWASRWDVYLSMNNRVDDDIHWFSIINSLLIVLFLTGMVAMIMMRTLHRDLTRYNRIPTDEEKAEEREESGWKLVHGDVFRPPAYPMLFSVTIGTGIQVFLMMIITLVFAAVGFLSPANRGSLMIALLILFVLMGVFAGYHAARTYKMFNGKQWQRCTLATAFLYPGIIFAIIFILDLIEWGEGSAKAIPFGSLCAVIALWFGVSVPLTFLGAYFGYRKDVDKQPVQTQDIPRQIPEQPWYLSTMAVMVVGGILPFGAVFVELFFILSSLWLDQYYYVFGFLLLVVLILIVTCAEMTIVLTYFQLCAEDYRWWWKSVVTSGSSAFYLFAYSAFYYTTRLHIVGFGAGFLYFGYMAIFSLLFFLFTGVIGYISAYWFNMKIYSAVKVD